MNDTQPVWSDDEIVEVLKRRAHHLKLSNGWRVITLIAAAELMRLVRDDMADKLAAARNDWRVADANLTGELAAANQRIVELEQQQRADRRLFEDMTPGGSEFHDSPRAVARWIQAQLESSRFAIIADLKKQLAAAQAALEAARAYDEAATKLHGEFARPNIMRRRTTKEKQDEQ